jgi:pyruvate-formate lyase
MHVRRVGSELSLFEQSQSVRESALTIRCLVQTRSKFWRHNPDVLRCTISGVQSENSGVMLPKFHPDPHQASCHKHTRLVTLGWV